MPASFEDRMRYATRRHWRRVGLTLIAAIAIFAGVLVAVFSSHNRQFQLRKAEKHLRAIGQAMFLHMNENGGQPPASLSELANAQDIGLEIFVSPRSATKVPAEVSSRPSPSSDVVANTSYAARRNHWIDEEADYVYVLPTRPNDLPRGQRIVAFERTERIKSKSVFVLFGDGHVELKPAVQVIAELAPKPAITSSTRP